MNILNKLTIKHLTMNKKRTLVTIIGIVLSTALMVGIGCLFSTFRSYGMDMTIQSNGSHHVELSNVEKDKFKYIVGNATIGNYTEEYTLGYSQIAGVENNYKPYYHIMSVKEDYYDNLKLISGSFPKNNSEIVISEHINSIGKVKYKVGETITIKMGKRILDTKEGPLELIEDGALVDGEYFKETGSKTYKIVGIVERSIYESYSNCGYRIFTKFDESDTKNLATLSTMITFKEVKNVQEKTEQILNTIDPSHKVSAKYNESLLALYGQSSYASVNNGLNQVLIIILSIITIGCTIVIYNSFAISVMERKKQFGLFSSIGATRKQLRKTVLFEAAVVGSIGILIGILSGIGGIWAVLTITNNLLSNVFVTKLTLSLYPIFIIIPVIYMIVTVFISAFIPAYRASKISPIEAIRLNDDIKMKKKKLKTNTLIRRIFGVEGELALKNIKRNKKKYRITILSLIVSIVLFLSFSTFLNYGISSGNTFLDNRDYDISVSLYTSDSATISRVEKKIDSLSDIDKYQKYDLSFVKWDVIDTNAFTSSYKKAYEKDTYIDCIVLKEKEYKEYLKKLGYSYSDYSGTELKPILINKIQIRDDAAKTVTEMALFKTNTKKKINFISDTSDVKEQKIVSSSIDIVNVLPDFINIGEDINIVISDKMKQNLPLYTGASSQMYYSISSSKHKEVNEAIKKILAEEGASNYSNSVDITEDAKTSKNILFVVKMFLYGFISLVTLIGITSVFNTINTSIALRSKEFAVLRSIGLTPKGFNSMLRFESLFYGMKALLYGIPLSIIVMLFLHKAFGNVVSYNTILIPWGAIVITVIAVFIITFITMQYATRKLKKSNIIDTIREENI